MSSSHGPGAHTPPVVRDDGGVNPTEHPASPDDPTPHTGRAGGAQPPGDDDPAGWAQPVPDLAESAEQAQRAEALRAGLQAYDLAEEDLALLQGGDQIGRAHV